MKHLKVRKRFKIFILGLIILTLDLVIAVPKLIEEYNVKKDEVLIEQYVDNFKNVEPHELNIKKKVKKIKNKYIAVLEIPSISLKKGIVNPHSIHNNVNENIEIIKPYHMPNESNRTMILASHSGTSKVAFFNDLKSLNLNDNVYIYYNNTKYKYKVIDKYKIKKIGYFNIKDYKKKTLLALVTCDVRNIKKQIVVICERIN